LWYSAIEHGSERGRIEGHNEIGKRNKETKDFLKQDANNFVTKENCWNFVTIALGINDYVLSSKQHFAAATRCELFSTKWGLLPFGIVCNLVVAIWARKTVF
jgi:hypothetical protein